MIDLDQQKNILVFDFGGGTLDVTIMQAQKNHYKIIAIKGDSQLGGQDIDYELSEHLF